MGQFNTIPPNPFPPSSESAGNGGGSYVLPVASSETLGGVKVGSGLSINAGGVLSANSQTVNFSTNEVNTGVKWIDNKDIFVKVYHADALANNADLTIEENFGVTKTLVKVDGVITTSTESGKYQYTVDYYSDSNDCAFVCVVQNNLLVRVRDNYSGYSGDFIVYYTKTEV